MTDLYVDINDVYNSVAQVPSSLVPLTFNEIVPTISATDIANGSIERFFIRQANHDTGYITEISSDDYNTFKSISLYNTISMTWRISGPLDDVLGSTSNNPALRSYTGVTTANQISLNAAEVLMPGMKTRIINLNQFYNF